MVASLRLIERQAIHLSVKLKFAHFRTVARKKKRNAVQIFSRLAIVKICPSEASAFRHNGFKAICFQIQNAFEQHV